MSRTNATVTEVGRRAGCSIATVSRVLNNSAGVSPKTREAVLKVVRETQYQYAARPSKRPGASVPKQTGGVIEIIQHRHSPIEQLSVDRGRLDVGPLSSPGLVLPAPLSNSFYRHIVDGAIDEMSAWNYRAQLRFNSDLMASDLLGDLNGPERDGIMLIGEPSPDLAAFMNQCLHPLVLVDIIHKGAIDVVTTDNYAGITLAVDHLLSLGHRRIGFLGAVETNPAFAERYAGFKLKMMEAGLPIRSQWVYGGEPHIEETAAGVREMLMCEERPTALVCANDCHAVGVMRAASALGIRIPDDLSVVGFDDVDFALMMTPPLTTVHVPLQEMGRQAVRQLMIAMQRGALGRPTGCKVRLSPELVVRQSTAAPAE